MRIKYLAQGEDILMLGFEPSTSVSKIDILTTRPICSNVRYIYIYEGYSLYLDMCYLIFVYAIVYLGQRKSTDPLSMLLVSHIDVIFINCLCSVGFLDS